MMPRDLFGVVERDLTAHLIEATNSFLAARGFAPVQVASLPQMSVPLNEAAREILMFGADIWPDVAQESIPIAA